MPEVKIVKTKERIAMSNLPIIKVKKLQTDATLPSQSQSLDAGYDLVAIDSGTVVYVIDGEENKGVIQYIEYQTGISIEPPSGYHIEIFPRSSISKYDLILANSIGLVDEGYRGQILVRFKYIPPLHDVRIVRGLPIKKYLRGDRIAQLVVRKTIQAEFVEVEDLSDSKREAGGFGSTGQ